MMFGFLWRATRGYRLRPWTSPYLKWRIETYWGIETATLSASGWFEFVWNRRAELLRFLRWAGRMTAAADR